MLTGDTYLGVAISRAAISAPILDINFDMGFTADLLNGKEICIRPAKNRVEYNHPVSKILKVVFGRKYKKCFTKGQAYVHKIQGE